MSFTYRVQDKAGGIAQALGLCEDFVGNDRMVVILGDNIFQMIFVRMLKSLQIKKEGAKVLLQSVDDPERFGVANIQNRKIIEIEEKPKEPKSSYAVTGIYLYDSKVFSYIKELKPSARGELEITDINNWYLKRGVLTYNEMSGWWTDAGTHVSLQRANALARDINFGKQFNGE